MKPDPAQFATTRRIRIALIRDGGLYPAAVHALLTAERDFWVYDLQMPRGRAVEHIDAFRPQILLTDRHSCAAHRELIQEICTRCRRAPLVMMQGLGSTEEDGNGTTGLAHPLMFSVRSANPADLMENIRTLVFGETPSMVARSAGLATTSWAPQTIDLPPAAGSPRDLSPRERQILAMVASGRSSRDIADRLGLSVCTVANHRAHLLRKLGCHNTAGLTRIALRCNLIS